MDRIHLVVAGRLQIVGAVGLKCTPRSTRLVPSAITLAAMLASVAVLGLALQTMPVGTGYAMWAGVGAVGGAILGIIRFAAPATARLGCIELAQRRDRRAGEGRVADRRLPGKES